MKEALRANSQNTRGFCISVGRRGVRKMLREQVEKVFETHQGRGRRAKLFAVEGGGGGGKEDSRSGVIKGTKIIKVGP